MHHRYCGEVLPYLEIQRSNVGEDDIVLSAEMPNITGLTVDEAKQTLQELGLEVEINGEGETVADQLPKTGIHVNAGTKVTVYVQ